jgi:hypothetical protein
VGRRQQFYNCLGDQRRWFTAAWFLDRLIEEEPARAQWFWWRGIARANLGRWRMALSDLTRATESPGATMQMWSDLVLVRRCPGDAEGSRLALTPLLERFSKTYSPRTAGEVAWICVRIPEAVVDPGRPLELARFAAREEPGGPDSLTGLGAAFYRAGRYDEAVSSLEEVIPRCHPQSYLA